MHRTNEQNAYTGTDNIWGSPGFLLLRNMCADSTNYRLFSQQRDALNLGDPPLLPSSTLACLVALLSRSPALPCLDLSARCSRSCNSGVRRATATGAPVVGSC